MRVAVIGSGPSGLISAKHCSISLKNLDYLHVYEQIACLGGAWCIDKKHTILYDNLRTNLPIELMTLEGVEYTDHQESSFVSAPTINKYIVKFSEVFHLEKYIKYETEVTKVSRVEGTWKLMACHLPTNEVIEEIYDVIFVCNGHYHVPEMPDFPELVNFKGNKEEEVVIHSKNYRKPEVYSGLLVLVIGGGPSGVDISIDVASQAKQVYLSHHCKDLNKLKFPVNIVCKPDVKNFDEQGVTFVDGSRCHIDRVILATGYRYQLDFLDHSCGVRILDHGYVTPLYKQLFSLTHPSMAFIGLPFRTFIFPLLEIQVKCVIQVLNGYATLPDTHEMYEDLKNFEMKNESKGVPKRRYHNIGDMVKPYVSEVINLGNLDPLPEVMFDIYEKSYYLRRTDIIGYRDHKFIIKNSEESIVVETE